MSLRHTRVPLCPRPSPSTVGTGLSTGLLLLAGGSGRAMPNGTEYFGVEFGRERLEKEWRYTGILPRFRISALPRAVFEPPSKT
jgi:hypothetical protein